MLSFICQVKRTSSWNKACEELKRHQDLLEKLRLATNNFTMPSPDSSSDDSDDDSVKVLHVLLWRKIRHKQNYKVRIYGQWILLRTIYL